MSPRICYKLFLLLKPVNLKNLNDDINNRHRHRHRTGTGTWGCPPAPVSAPAKNV